MYRFGIERHFLTNVAAGSQIRMIGKDLGGVCNGADVRSGKNAYSTSSIPERPIMRMRSGFFQITAAPCLKTSIFFRVMCKVKRLFFIRDLRNSYNGVTLLTLHKLRSRS